jgi:hypothetical protein
MLLMNLETKETCEIQIEARDERMASAFKAAGPHWVDAVEMKSIDTHSSVVYLIGHGGSQTNLAPLMHAARALLNAGGLGVKVESTGVAHSPEAWRRLCDELHLFSAHEAWVLYITGDDAYSCGMHNLGLKDAIVASDLVESPADLLRAFTHYIFSERPKVRSGQTFSVAVDAPIYRVVDDEGIQYDASSLFNNPYGFWRLVPDNPEPPERGPAKRPWWKLGMH